MAIDFTHIFSLRINALMDALGHTPTLPKKCAALAELCKVSSQAARKWLEGRNPPTTENLLIIAKEYGTIVSWLIGEIDDFERGQQPAITIGEDGTSLLAATRNYFGGQIRRGDQVVVKADFGMIKDGGIYLYKTPRGDVFRQVWIEPNNMVKVQGQTKKGVLYPLNELANSLTGEVIAVIRRV